MEKMNAIWHRCCISEASDPIVTKTVHAFKTDADQTVEIEAPSKSALDLNDEGEVSDELDDQLFGQFADVMSKVWELKCFLFLNLF